MLNSSDVINRHASLSFLAAIHNQSQVNHNIQATRILKAQQTPILIWLRVQAAEFVIWHPSAVAAPVLTKCEEH